MMSARISPMLEMYPYCLLGLSVGGFLDCHNAFRSKRFVDFPPGRITQTNVY